MSGPLGEKQKLTMLVKQYAEALHNDNIDLHRVSTRLPSFKRESETSVLTKAFLELARDALKPPYVSYFKTVPHELAPFHLFHLDQNVLSLHGLQEALKSGIDGLNKYLERCLQRREDVPFTNALMSFTDPIPRRFEVREDLEEIFAAFLTMSRLNGHHFGTLIQKLIRECDVDPAVSVRIGNHDVTFSILYSRFLAFLLVSSICVNFQETIEIASHVALQLDTESATRELAHMFGTVSPDTLKLLVVHYQENLTVQLYGGERQRASNDDLRAVAQVIGIFNRINYAKPHPRGLIPYSAFYNQTALDFDIDSMKVDFQRRLTNQERHENGSEDRIFAFSDFPFLIDANFKSVMLQFESLVNHRRALQNAMMGMLFSRSLDAEADYFCVLNIQRDRLIESTLREMNRKRDGLRKPLRIKFTGEEGIDEGGPRKEFFQLVCKELFDPNYGMFVMDEARRFFWIQPTIKCPSCKVEFFLVGQLIGLAVFNNVILDVAFPRLLFRKLLGLEVGLEDLRELDSGFAEGLDELLKFQETEASLEEVFCRNFVFEHDVFGQTVEIEIIPNGRNVPLTGANRQQFVDSMVDYVLNRSVEENFREFRKGFHSICESELITTMAPEELELLVCGNPQLDFVELEKSTKYDGYQPTDTTVKLFWEVVHELTPEQKRLLLKFCTGSDRVPIRGLKDLGFVIGKNGDDSELLPTSHTCFNHLLLPQYRTKALLKKKLLLAIENCTGFGLK